MSETLTVFLNGATLRLAPGSTVLDAVRAADPTAAEAVQGGTRAVADSRGLVVPPETPLTGGFVMRLVSARQLADRATDE
jgi:hypothetical protein